MALKVGDGMVQGIAFNGLAADTPDQSHQLIGRHGRVLLLGAGHRVDFGRIINRAVDVIDTESQSHLRNFPADHRPVGLEMIEIIQVNTTDGVVAQVFDDRAFRHVRHLIVFVAKFEWNKGLKASRFVLQIP